MVAKTFLNGAHQSLRESWQANARGEYLYSWGKTAPARLYYLTDALVNAGALPFYSLGAGYGVAEVIYTWGKETSHLTESLKGIDNSLSRVFFGSVGAVVFPAAAQACEVDSALKVVATAAVVSAIGLGVFLVANHFRLPNFVMYNAASGFTWGWHWP